MVSVNFYGCILDPFFLLLLLLLLFSNCIIITDDHYYAGATVMQKINVVLKTYNFIENNKTLLISVVFLEQL